MLIDSVVYMYVDIKIPLLYAKRTCYGILLLGGLIVAIKTMWNSVLLILKNNCLKCLPKVYLFCNTNTYAFITRILHSSRSRKDFTN